MKKAKKGIWAVILTICSITVQFGVMVLEVSANDSSYAVYVSELKANQLSQKVSVNVNDQSFFRTMEDLSMLPVVVLDKEDGSRICSMIDIAYIEQFVEEINTALGNVPGDDSFYYYDEGTGGFSSCQGSVCYQVSDSGKERIYNAFLQAFASKGGKDVKITLKGEDLCLKEMDIPTEILLNRYGIQGSCTTNFKGSSSNRIQNIQTAAANVNQFVLYPGMEVSMNELFKPRTSANGYREAGTYYNGKVVPGMGGGICQVSSTVYNAVMNSGLTVLERHPHSMPVHYLPLGMDAAISSGSKDLKVRNDYSFPVLFEAYTSGKNLTVNIYTNQLGMQGASYRLHSVKKSSLSASTYLEVSVNGSVVEDRYVGFSKYNPMLPSED